MKRIVGMVLAALVPLSIGSFGLGGCGDATTEEDEAIVSNTDDLWGRGSWRHRRPSPTPTPAPGGTAGQGGQQPGTADGCEVCAEAKSCCDEVTSSGPLCTYDAAYCATLDEVRRAAYINACKTLKTVTVQSWQLKGVTPPTSCL